MFKLFKKKTREQLVLEKTEKVFVMLTNDAETNFTELEIVQIHNHTRARLHDYLVSLRTNEIELSQHHHQRAEEINNAITNLKN